MRWTSGDGGWMGSLQDDGPVDLIRPFEELGRRMIRGWSPSHVSAALPGRRSNYPRKIHNEAWQTLFELSRYARQGILPLYPAHGVNASERISPSTVWLIYPLYPTPPQMPRGRGLVELIDGTMIEALADITRFRQVLKSEHPPLPPTGRPRKYPDYFVAAKAFWHANPGLVKTGVVIDHIKTHEPGLHDAVPSSTRYRLVCDARVEAREVG